MTIQVTGRFQDSELAGKFSALLELTRREYEAARKHGREQDFVASVAGLIEDATWDMLNVGVPTLEYKPIDHAAYARDRVENGLDIEPTADELAALDGQLAWDDEAARLDDPDADQQEAQLAGDEGPWVRAAAEDSLYCGECGSSHPGECRLWQYEEPVGLQPISDSEDPDEREETA